MSLPAPGRAVDLAMRVSAPTTGRDLPIILLSHGHGQSNHLSSLNGYGPLVNFWAAHGFVVIQPTHLSSKSLSVNPSTPGAPLFWRSRVEDMRHILDGLDAIETAVAAVSVCSPLSCWPPRQCAARPPQQLPSIRRSRRATCNR